MDLKRTVVALAAAGALASIDAAAISSAQSQSQTVTPPFRFTAHRLSPAVRKRITGVSWHRGCPVGLGGLRYLRISHYGVDGRIRSGEMIAAASAAPALRRAFARLYRSRFPIRRMRLVDDYGGSDFRSI